MEDLAEGLQQEHMVMLGGGNPALIPEVHEVYRQTVAKLLENGKLLSALENYDGPQGNEEFLDALADYFNHHYQWGITRRNISLTHGSQSAFFALFNSFAGTSGSIKKKVLLPLTPEYIGYSDLGIEDDLFVSQEPLIERLEDGFFKYHINFENLEVSDEIGLICVSRPTNPSGNVLTDSECKQLAQIASSKGVPLLVDNAYGTPFPHIIFNDVTPFWDENTILSMSLSKLGLPGVRTGIVIANEALIKQLSNMTSVTSLSPGGVGPAVALGLLRNNLLETMSQKMIKPFYQQRRDLTVNLLQKAIPDRRLHIHVPEGAIFLWLWFENLKVDSMTLYQKLKQRGLLIVPGRYFFPGQKQLSEHADSCIRLNYVQQEQQIRRGVGILAETLQECW